MSYRNDSYEDELDRMRARQSKKKKRIEPDEDYDVYQDALEKELDRTMHLSETEPKFSRSGSRRAGSGTREGAVREKTHRKRKKPLRVGKILCLVVLLAAGMLLYNRFRSATYWTVAVFGVDSRDGNLEKGALSDVEMLASINKKTGEIRLVSVFRDSYLRISDENDSYDKINEAYFLGGHEQAVQALKTNLDLKIDDYATFNWKAVVDAINILGGVDIEITDKEFAYINSFITETVNSTGVGSYQLEHSGMNHLDGVQAVAYARLRLMDTDFNRTERQRKVLGQAMEKAKSAGFKTLSSLVGAVYPQISTSIGMNDILTLAKGAKKYYIGQTSGFPFSHQEMKIGKKACVIPTTLESNVVQLHTFLYDETQYLASSKVKEISNAIAQKTGLGDPGKDTESGKNVGAQGNSGGGQTSGKSEQPAAVPVPTESTAVESSVSVEETTETVEETQESREPETEETSGVITAPSKQEPESPNTQGPGENKAPAAEAGPGTSGPGSGTSNAPTAAETSAALEAPGQASGPETEISGPGV